MKDTEYKKGCFESILKLSDLYNRVNRAIKSAEVFDEERKTNIAPINQLRSSLDHIFKAVSFADDEQQCDYEIKEAKEHLERAGYDALEILAGIVGTKIVESLSMYSTRTITVIYPKYFTVIKPKLTEIRHSVSVLRSEKKIESEKSFSDYLDQIEELVDIDKEVNCMIPSLQEFQDREQKELEKDKAESENKEKKLRRIGNIKAIIATIITFILTVIGGIIVNAIK